MARGGRGVVGSRDGGPGEQPVARLQGPRERVDGGQLEGLFAIADDLSWQPRPFIDAIYLTDVRRTA